MQSSPVKKNSIQAKFLLFIKVAYEMFWYRGYQMTDTERLSDDRYWGSSLHSLIRLT